MPRRLRILTARTQFHAPSKGIAEEGSTSTVSLYPQVPSPPPSAVSGSGTPISPPTFQTPTQPRESAAARHITSTGERVAGAITAGAVALGSLIGSVGHYFHERLSTPTQPLHISARLMGMLASVCKYAGHPANPHHRCDH